MILHDKIIRKNLSESVCYRDTLTDTDVESIWKLAFNNGNVRKNKLGNIFISGRVVNEAYECIKDKILVQGRLYG